jgi:glutathione S-transferase
VISLNADDFSAGEQDFGHGQVPALADGSVQVKVAGDPRIFAGFAAGLCTAPLSRAGALGRDACRFLSRSPPFAHEHVAAGRHRDLTLKRPNVRRIDAIWTDCRTRYGSGAFLFGAFGATGRLRAVVFHTYAVGRCRGPRVDAVMLQLGANGTAALAEPGCCRGRGGTGRPLCA